MVFGSLESRVQGDLQNGVLGGGKGFPGFHSSTAASKEDSQHKGSPLLCSFSELYNLVIGFWLHLLG